MRNSIFIVFYTEPWVGTFFQAAFSDREKAPAFLDTMPYHELEESYIEEYTLDSQERYT